MALLSNQGEPVSGWWLSKSLKSIKSEPDFFSTKKLRKARIELIAGTNRLQTIEAWLNAAALIEKDTKKRTTEYYLTDFGHFIMKNDPDFQKASSWWAIHLQLCFSSKSDPYSHFFKVLGSCQNSWVRWTDLLKKINELEEFMDNKSTTIEYATNGIRRMFEGDRPLCELALLNLRKQSYPSEIWLQIGLPVVPDEVFIYGLSLAREKLFKTRKSIDFSELAKCDFHSYLCISLEELAKRLRKLNQDTKWDGYFAYTEAVNLNSISFMDDLNTRKTLLLIGSLMSDIWM